MARRAFDRKLQSLQAIRSLSDAREARAQLRQALGDRNNLVVARAAAIAADLDFDDLIGDLLGAYDRFFIDPEKTDPQCLAKAGIAKALRQLGHHGAPAYLRGIAYFQFESGWGGRAETAAQLRGTCALALSECPIDDLEILIYLADALADPDQLVRTDAVVAIEQLGRVEGALLLRLKAQIGDPEQAVLGQCFASFLNLAPPGAVKFVTRFLDSRDSEVQLQAASALAECRDPAALDVLKEFWNRPVLSMDLRRAILISLGGSPVREAADFLLRVITEEPVALGATALAALASSRFAAPMRDQVIAAVESRSDRDLRAALQRSSLV